MEPRLLYARSVFPPPLVVLLLLVLMIFDCLLTVLCGQIPCCLAQAASQLKATSGQPSMRNRPNLSPLLSSTEPRYLSAKPACLSTSLSVRGPSCGNRGRPRPPPAPPGPRGTRRIATFRDSLAAVYGIGISVPIVKPIYSSLYRRSCPISKPPQNTFGCVDFSMVIL
ncbi:unnamed protein product [Ectocarpus sp. 4 AP-2014]